MGNQRMFIDTQVPDHISDAFLENLESIYWALEKAKSERKHPSNRVVCQFAPMGSTASLTIPEDTKVFLFDDYKVEYNYIQYGKAHIVEGLTVDQFCKIVE